MMLRPLIGTLGDSAGLVPMAMTMRSASKRASLAVRAFDADVMRVDEAGDAVSDVDAIAGELRLGDIDFGLDDVLDAEGEIGHGDVFFHAIVHAVDRAVVEAGEMQHGLAHGLGGNGAGVDADTADQR